MAGTLVWFRQDLRLEDNPALIAAAARGGPVVPVFVWAPHEEGDWPPGGASRWWLHHSLHALDRSLRRIKSRLIIRQGNSLEVLGEIAERCGLDAVYWNRRYEPAAIARDTRIKQALGEVGIEAASFNAGLLHEPWEVRTQQGEPYKVFTPFWRTCLGRGEPAAPVPAPAHLASPRSWPESAPLETLGLLPTIDWAGELEEAWSPGESGALAELERFLDDGLSGYAEGRNRPDYLSTSRLSPHLHWGEIGPRQIWHAVSEALSGEEPESPTAQSIKAFLNEIGWREFAHHLLYHFPHTPVRPLREEFARFPWVKSQKLLQAWQRGRTGYPIVDAGMRELWHTGWMHNRVRMIVASFLVKDLRLSWQEGARWFWDTLVDADLANNTLGWQWSAGCGADAAPYFRVFNPVTQGRRFDPVGGYVRRWVPELAGLPDDQIHAPHECGDDLFTGTSSHYPRPIVDHAEARQAALAAFAGLRG